jgi:SAM-dependent methyltransferase
MKCTICGGTKFNKNKVLWPELCKEWGLNPNEIEYINNQQGFSCVQCGNNLRSMALAKAILSHLQDRDTLSKALTRFRYRKLRLLEINKAGNLSPYLIKLPKHLLIEYPEADMMNLQFQEGTWDMVVHSDTLEHVPDPLKGLQQIHRILKKGGVCIFTIPIIIGRMTRSREGLQPSFHGDPNNQCSDYKVITEFGADAWTFAMSAGFEMCKIHAIDYPSGIALEAVK